MNKRIEALITVKKYLGNEKLIEIVSKDESKEIFMYINTRYFSNTREMTQEKEMEYALYQQEGASIGFKDLNELKDICYQIMKEGL